MADHIIIRGGRLLDIRRHAAEPVDIRIEGDTIAELGPPGMAAPEGARVVDAADRLMMPGLVNAHTHGHGALSKGLSGDRWPLELLLNANPAINAERNLQDKRLAATVAAVEMIRKGCTAAYDLFAEFPEPSAEGVLAAASGYEVVGMRAVVAPMMADRTLFQAYPGLVEGIPEPWRARAAALAATPWQTSIEACRKLLAHWPFDRERIRPALAPTIPLHCSDDFLAACRDLAREHGINLQTHLAESKNQATFGYERYGCSLVQHLDGLGMLAPDLSAAHAIWLDPDDLQRMADSGVRVAHNPASNLRLGSGLAAVRQMRELGITVGIGTDAANCSDGQNMFEGARLASYISRVQGFEYEQWLGADEVLDMATAGSARVLGFERLGRLLPGYKADIVFLDLGHIHYLPLNDPVVQLVNSETGAAVTDVMIGGRLVLERGRLTTIDETKLRADIEEANARLTAANAERRELARALEPFVGAFCATHAAHRRFEPHRHAGRLP